MTDTSIAVQLNPADYETAERHIVATLRRQTSWYWPARLAGWVVHLLWILGFIGLFTYQTPRSDSVAAVRASALMLLAAFVLAATASLLQKRAIARVLYAHGSKLLEPYTLTVEAEGISVVSASGTAKLRWSAFPRIELEGRLLYLFTQPNYALIIPERAFATRPELVSFADEIKRKKELSDASSST